MVNDLASQLGLPVILEDAHQQPMAYSPHYDLADQMRMDSIMRLSTSQEVVDYFTPWGLNERREPFIVPGNPDIKVLPRLCVPIRSRAHVIGYLWVLLPDQDIEQAQIDEAVEAAALLRQRLLVDAEVRGVETELLLSLVSSSQQERARGIAIAEGRYRMVVGRPCAVLVCFGSGWEQLAVRARFWNAVWGPGGHDQIRGVTDSEGVAIITDGRAGASLRASHEPLLAGLRQAAGGGGTEDSLTIGVSDWVDSPEFLHQAYQRAQIAARVAAHIFPERLGYWAELGAYRFLGQLAGQALVDAVDPRVLALVNEEPRLAKTVWHFLESRQSTTAIARDLGIHRATLYNRLDRVSERGLDPRHAPDATILQMGLYALTLAGHVNFSTIV